MKIEFELPVKRVMYLTKALMSKITIKIRKKAIQSPIRALKPI